MRHLLLLLAVGLCACNDAKIAQLEKENKELRKQVAASERVDLAIQEKCASAAQRYFQREFPPDKRTLLLSQQNHYNQALGKCFIFIEWHYRLALNNDSWSNSISVYDVFENNQVAQFSQLTHVGGKSEPTLSSVHCEVAGKKCASIDEFNRAVQPFMSD